MFILYVARYYRILLGVDLCTYYARRNRLFVLDSSSNLNSYSVVRITVLMVEFIRGFSVASIVDRASTGQNYIYQSHGGRLRLLAFEGVFNGIAFGHVLSGLRR